MADAVNDLVLQVITEASFDVPSESALRWLTTRQRTMVDRSRCLRKTIGIGPVVPGVAAYDLPPDIIEVQEVLLDGRSIRKVDDRNAQFVTSGPAWADENLKQIRVIPAPTSVVLLQVRGAYAAPDLVAGDNTTLVVPLAYVDALVAGAIATGFARVEERPDLAAPHEQIFAAACEELRKDTARRMRGFGPTKIRVRG